MSPEPGERRRPVPAERPAQRPGDEGRPPAGREGEAAEASESDPAEAWEPEGLTLARAVAKAVAAGGSAGGREGARGRTSRRSEGGRRGSRSRPSGAGPDDRDPQTLDATVGRLVAERGWETDVAVAGALARWADIVGPEVAAHCRAERYAEAELTVRADSTAWATQVRMLAPTVVRRLNEELGDGTVRRVNVLGPAQPTWGRGARRLRGGRGPRDTYG